MPVDGPARIASTMTSGVSVTPETPNSSTLSESPGPLVPIMLTAPAALAPRAARIDSRSLEPWRARPPYRGRCRSMYSRIDDAGVMGYPA